MPLYLPLGTTDPVIKVGGICYQLNGPSQIAPDTLAWDGPYTDCVDCASVQTYCVVVFSNTYACETDTWLNAQGMQTETYYCTDVDESYLDHDWECTSDDPLNPYFNKRVTIPGTCDPLDQNTCDATVIAADAAEPLPTDYLSLCPCPFVPSLQCVGGTQPSMVLRVSGQTGDITWCGETWGAGDQNTPKEVCPSNYFKTHYENLGTSNVQRIAKHNWGKAGGVGLAIGRSYSANKMTTSLEIASNRAWNAFNIGTLVWAQHTFWFNGQGWPGPAYTSDYCGFQSGYTTQIGFLCGISKPTYNDYALTDAFFDSVTIDGVTYSWSKGTNW